LFQKLRKLQNLRNPKRVLTADLSEGDAEDSQNSSFSSISQVKYVGYVVVGCSSIRLNEERALKRTKRMAKLATNWFLPCVCSVP
jgi:hypothetical protein